MPPRVARWVAPAAWVAGVSAALLLVFPVGFPNYDTIYALVWGRELAHGMSPDYGAALPPTPHPLTDLIGLVTAPFGDGAITVTMILAYVSLGLIGYFVYRLGRSGSTAGWACVAAAIVLTRAPFLSNGLRAYVDLPYIALCLGALHVEARRPRAGWPVLALLVPAGPAAPRGLAIRDRLLALAGLRPPPRAGTCVDGPKRLQDGEFSAHQHGRPAGNWGGGGSGRRAELGLARRCWRWPGRSLGALRRDHHR